MVWIGLDSVAISLLIATDDQSHDIDDLTTLCELISTERAHLVHCDFE